MFNSLNETAENVRSKNEKEPDMCNCKNKQVHPFLTKTHLSSNLHVNNHQKCSRDWKETMNLPALSLILLTMACYSLVNIEVGLNQGPDKQFHKVTYLQ